MFQPREYVIIGVDPGLMTGVFLYSNLSVRFMDSPSGDHVAAAEMPRYLRDTVSKATDFVGYNGVHVAVERYIITPKTAKLSQQTEALEVTGVAKAIVSLYAATEVRQYAKSNLKFASDDMLKAVGWYNPKMRHANDAARQAFALLKDLDYPRWSALVSDASLESEDEGRKTL
jgi:hypothetical protein